MSDSGNTGEPRADAGEQGSARRRVGEVRREHEAERKAQVKRREKELGTSWSSVNFAWLAALGASLILSGIVGAILGLVGVGGGTAALIGFLLTLFLAFL